MEVTSIRDRFIDQILTLEELQDEMFTSLSELASPAYYNSSLPTFTKRLSSLHGNNNNELVSLDKNYRSTQLKIIIEKWRNVLGSFREKIETSDSLQSGQYQEMLNVIDDAKSKEQFPMIMPPSLQPLLDSIKRAGNDNKKKIIVGRLESAYNIFENIIKTSREASHQRWALTESSCDTQQVMIESLLKMFYRDLYNLSVTLKHFYDKKLAIDAKKFQKYTDHQKELAIKHQSDSYKEMCKSITAQHVLFRNMISCMNEELDSLPPRDKLRAKKRLDELEKRNQEILIQAEVYYEASRNVVLPQSLSTFFYKSIKEWLYDYQKLLVEILSIMITRGASDAISASTAGLQKSVLYNYAKRIDSSKLIDLAAIGNNFIFPTSDSVNDILVGFHQFHLNNNKQNLTQLKHNIDKMVSQYDILKNNVQEMIRTQQKYYSSKDSKLPNIMDAASTHGTSPEIIKLLLKLDRDLKISEAKLQNMYHNIFNVMGADYSKLEHQNKKLVEIVDYLKQYAFVLREWEDKIKQEQVFIQKWKDVRKYNSRHMSLQFMEWNHFVTEEVDIFHKTIGLYSVSIFHKIKEIANDFMTQLLNMSNRRNEVLEGEMKLINNLYNDVRSEDLTISDDLIRIQGQLEQWINDMNYLYQVYFEYRLRTVVSYYLSALENLLDRFHEQSELGSLLSTLDNMYNLGTETLEEEKEIKKSKFLLNRKF